MSNDHDQAARLRWARLRAGFKNKKDATDRFGWTYSSYAAHENGNRTLEVDTALKYARAYRVNFAWLAAGIGAPFVSRLIPIEGYLADGAQVFAVDDQRFAVRGSVDEVELPPGAIEDLLAFRVKGDFNYPMYRDGDVIFVARDGGLPSDFLNEECVVRLADGTRLLRTIAKGPTDQGFILISGNQPPIVEAAIEWASPVAWVKRALR